jgi:hypothetical protein
MKIEKNTILLTKDGRVFGNSIVTKVNDKGKFKTFDIKTDYGNEVKDVDRRFLIKQFWIANEFQMINVENHKHFTK